MTDKIYQFYAHSIAGLEEVVREDVRQCLEHVTDLRLERGPRQGRVLFTYERRPRCLLEVRSAISTYGLLADIRRVTVGRPGLQRVLQVVETLPVEAARSLVRACDPAADVAACRVTAIVRGSHRFTGRELTAAAADVLGRAHGLGRAGQGRALHFQIQVAGSRALVGVQVGTRREPGSPRRDGMGAPLAYCVARLLDLQTGDRVLAAGCNPSGAAELARATGAVVLQVAWPASGRGAAPGGSGGSAPTCRAAALPGNLPTGDGAATAALAVVADAAGSRAAAGFEIVPELARGLAAGGVAAVLAAAPRGFLQRLRAASLPFEVLAGLSIGVGGRPYGLYLLERTDLSLLEL